MMPVKRKNVLLVRLSVVFLVVMALTVGAVTTGPSDALATNGDCRKKAKVKNRHHKRTAARAKVKCVRGRKGPKGPKGDDGKEGKDGKDGADGAGGADGADGADGTDGREGKDGRDGTDGREGKDGRDGRDGTDGRDGKDGMDGREGRDGRDGDKGDKGERGKKGKKGDPGPPGIVGDPLLVSGELVLVPANGSVAVSGGECPTKSKLVGGAFSVTPGVFVTSFGPSVRAWKGNFLSGNRTGSAIVSSVCLPTS
jgi:Collagen triple helix repeat (20 copies)